MIVFLIIALYSEKHDLEKAKTFRVFMWVYNIGVPLTAVMLTVRGIFQVNGTALSSAADAVIS